MGAEQLDFTGGMNTSPEAIEAVISRMCHFVAAKDAEIAKLRAERDASRLISEGLHSSNAALRAALKVERDACDAWRASWNVGGYESLKAAEEYHDQRRAAEAKGETK